MSMLMAGSVVAECLFTIDDFTVTPDQIGTEIALTVKAEFSARVNSWQVDFTYPEGLTPTRAEAGADFDVTYDNAYGNTVLYTPGFFYTANYSRFIAYTTVAGYWYSTDTDEYTSYGLVKWEGGTYEEMFILYVEVTEEFHGGQIIITTQCSSDNDARGGTVRVNGDNMVAFTSECNVTLSDTEAYACYTSSNTTLTFYYDNQRSSRAGTTYSLNTGYTIPDWFNDGSYYNVTKVVFATSFAGARPTSTAYWFYFMENLQSITGLNYLNTSEVTNMSAMFEKCSSLTSLNLSSFNTSKVTAMEYMFYGCSSLTSLDLSSFNTSNVTYMENMFYNCSSLTRLDLSSFNTSKVKYMDSMFRNNSNLRTIYVGNGWSTAAVTGSLDMFYNCTSLVGGKGTTYDANHTDKAYAHLDGGPSNPGYFTSNNVSLLGDVDADGNVTISDVTALIDYLLSGNASGVNLTAADCDLDGSITITDVTVLIDALLTGHW
jgi:surface protein